MVLGLKAHMSVPDMTSRVQLTNRSYMGHVRFDLQHGSNVVL